jgi:hypothetical protein
VSASLQIARGFQSSPYRFVTAADGSRAPERHPDRRLRAAASAFIVRSLSPLLAARLSYRFYGDDWGIRSHTGEARIVADRGGRWFASAEARAYQQSDAVFYRKGYPLLLEHMSDDRELSRFWDISASLQGGLRAGAFELDARLGAIYYDFKNFRKLDSRRAWIGALGARRRW